MELIQSLETLKKRSPHIYINYLQLDIYAHCRQKHCEFLLERTSKFTKTLIISCRQAGLPTRADHYHPSKTSMKGFVLLLALAAACCASLLAALPAGDPAVPAVTKPLKAEALISGLEKKVFEDLPPVLVQLSNLPASAAVWVEVVRGQGVANRRGKTVESKFFLRKGGAGVLSVPGIHKACRSEGTWTLRVLMSDARGTTVLSTATFTLQSEIHA